MRGIKSCTKLKPLSKSVYYFDKKGKRKEKTVIDDDIYLVVLNNRSSFAANSKTLRQMGIAVEEIVKKDEKITSQIQENVDDFDDDDDLLLNSDSADENSDHLVDEVEQDEISLVDNSQNLEKNNGNGKN